MKFAFIKIKDLSVMLSCCTVGREREIVQIMPVIGGLGREFGRLTNHALAKELQQEPAVLSRGLGKLASKLELRGVVETLCDRLRMGRRPKRSIRFA